LIVAGETASTVAVSSTVSPPKKTQLHDARLIGVELLELLEGDD
jgi:hypothetical protein